MRLRCPQLPVQPAVAFPAAATASAADEAVLNSGDDASDLDMQLKLVVRQPAMPDLPLPCVVPNHKSHLVAAWPHPGSLSNRLRCFFLLQSAPGGVG